VAATTAKSVWCRGNRYDVLGEDAHTLPVGGRILLRGMESRPCGPRGMPYIRLGRYRGDVVEDHGGSTSPLFRGSNLTTREDDGGWIEVTPEPRALRYPYSVLSFGRIGRWWRKCKMLGLGQDVRVRVSDPAMRIAMPRSPGVGQQGPMMGTDHSVTLRHDDVQQGPMMGTEVSVTLRNDEVMGIVRNPGGPVGSLKACGPRGPLECSCDPKLVPTPAQGARDDHGCRMRVNDPVPSITTPQQ
jgi:hypothetical protein